VFLDVHDPFFLADENQVNRKEHPDRMHTAGGYDPQTSAKLRPALGFSKEADETKQIAVGNGRLSGQKSFARLVVHVQRTVLTIMGHGATHLLQFVFKALGFYSTLLRLRR
jgi:hypothetical protein